VLGLLIGWTAVGLAQPRERIEDWRKYQELTRAADPRADKAHSIFKRLLQVAGTRPDVVPQLFITASDPWDIALPIALSDGWIVLSKGALDICYRDPARGDDRLAFVLAHELAHLLNDDLAPALLAGPRCLATRPVAGTRFTGFRGAT
jgi:Zn-dependent protease with chaperone function